MNDPMRTAVRDEFRRLISKMRDQGMTGPERLDAMGKLMDDRETDLLDRYEFKRRAEEYGKASAERAPQNTGDSSPK